MLSASFANVTRSDQNLHREVKDEQDKVVSSEVKKRRVLSALYEINRNMKKALADKSDLERNLEANQESNRDLQQKIDELRSSTAELKSLIRERLRAIYIFGQHGTARLMWSSESASELDRNLKILGAVSQRDLKLVKGYSASQAELQKKQRKLDERLQHFLALQGKLERQQKSLDVDLTNKQRILDRLRAENRKALNKLGQLRQSERKLSSQELDLNELLSRPAFFEMKGTLVPPLPGAVVQAFGFIRHPLHRTVVPHKGVQIKAQGNDLVKTVFEGTVVYADELEGYGKTVIIDHGDHYYSVYAHLDSLHIQEGQFLATADPLGRLSAQANQNLYFELRHFSEPINPTEWLKGAM
ncbi:MAG: murein hydrolase activator EnvC family protein [Pseudobdellovibrionaceae bacterium]